MIKCNLNVCGTITTSASVKTNNSDESFLSFPVKLSISARDGEKKELILSVTCSGNKSKALEYSAGRRVKMCGVMYIRKKDGRIWYNFNADKLEVVGSKEEDFIDGTMEFRGKVSKKGVALRKDQKGNDYKTFSAFSSDKNGDKSEFIWVSFLYFNPKEKEDFLQANTYIQCEGNLQLGIYKDEISIDCLVSQVGLWILDNKNTSSE